MTLDGKVMRPEGRWFGLTSEEDRKRMLLYRNESDALILGVSSLNADDPDPYSDSVRTPIPVVPIRRTLPDTGLKLFQNKLIKPILYAGNDVSEDKLIPYEELATIIRLNADLPDPALIMRDLNQKGYRRVLLEGGPTLNYSFFQMGLVDRINLTLVPYIIGMEELPGIVRGAEPFFEFDSRRWKLVYCEMVESEVFLSYEKV